MGVRRVWATRGWDQRVGASGGGSLAKKRAAQIAVNRSWCKRCGICVAFCPSGVLRFDGRGHPEVADVERCTVCRLCELRCPDFAIEVAEEVGGGVRTAAHAG